MDIKRTIQKKRKTILKLARQYGAMDIRIFGSVARGEADDRSDVDFLVRMERGRSLFDMGGLLMDLERLLNRSVDVVTENSLRDRIRKRVLQESIPL